MGRLLAGTGKQPQGEPIQPRSNGHGPCECRGDAPGAKGPGSQDGPARPLHQKEATLPPRLPGAQSQLGSDLAAQARVQMIANIQRELNRKGFYDGPSDGIWGSKRDAAVRDFLQASGSKVNPEANENLLGAISNYVAKPTTAATAQTPPATDPIAKLIAPSKRIVSIQRALADFG